MIVLCRKTGVTVQELPSGELLMHGQFEDENHLLDVQITVNRQSGTVTSAYASMSRTPHGEVCLGPLAAADRLVGLAIGPGSARKVASLLGGPRGCTHLVDLVVEIFRAYLPSLARFEEFRLTGVYGAQSLSPEEVRAKVFDDIRDLGRRVIPNSCAAYETGGAGNGGPTGGGR